ncbi:hypothetical protein ACHAPT_011036 [Fusarium lateritium]
MKPSLDNLPAEVLAGIFGHFCSHCRAEFREPPRLGVPFPDERHRPADSKSRHRLDQGALFSLGLTCKRLSAISQAILYHEFVPGYDDSSPLTPYGRFASFMRTIGRRRDLAASVRKVAMSPSSITYKQSKGIRNLLLESAATLNIDLAEAWKRRASDTSTSNQRKRSQEYDQLLRVWLTSEVDNVPYDIPERQRGQDDFNALDAEVTVMLLALVPNIEQLSLWTYERAPLCLCTSAFRAFGITSLPKLKALEIEANPDAILELATGLEALNVRDCTPQKSRDCADLPHLETVRLAHTVFDSETVGIIISRCTRRLRGFMADEILLARTPVSVIASEAMDALKDHQETLEILHLDLRPGACIRPRVGTFTLVDFSSLHHVRLSTPVIFHSISADPTAAEEENHHRIWSRLPASLVSLCLMHENTDLDAVREGLMGLAEMKRSNPELFPRLQRVGVGRLDVSYLAASAFDKMQGVDQVMKAANITFTLDSPRLL